MTKRGHRVPERVFERDAGVIAGERYPSRCRGLHGADPTKSRMAEAMAGLVALVGSRYAKVEFLSEGRIA
ncbi:hypothetical protein TMPK1_08710 [Rhodospirillales bacterium TMPK1]|uniref:Uncharacterized protein n=1 Tax=Roseiterribacter gracilis TaxID=2812848 RepID=A0A8S8X7X1_9PROT|nr:hypothetical protein TMPK1_08710 [Rhodospirillales bacterium TMPK1]